MLNLDKYAIYKYLRGDHCTQDFGTGSRDQYLRTIEQQLK